MFGSNNSSSSRNISSGSSINSSVPCIYQFNILSYYYSILFLFLVGSGVCKERGEDRVPA